MRIGMGIPGALAGAFLTGAFLAGVSDGGAAVARRARPAAAVVSISFPPFVVTDAGTSATAALAGVFALVAFFGGILLQMLLG